MAIKPALIERLNSKLPIPYVWSTLIVAALLGPLGFYIADLLSYTSLSAGTSFFINRSFSHYTLSQAIGNDVVYPAIIFYCAYMLRYMRRRINQAEEELVQQSPEWADTIRRSFGRVSHTGPSLGVTLLIFLLSLPLVVSQVSNNQGLSQLYFAITYPLFFFGAGSFIWMYVSSLWGLYKIGTGPIKLRPYAEDKLLGLGGLGRISLTLTTVFMVAVFLATYEFTAYAAAMPILLTIFFSGILIMLGVSMFFLPLLNIHARMTVERERLRSHNLGAIMEIFKEEDTGRSHSPVHSLRRILLLEHEGEQIRAIPSWPFDIEVTRLLATVVFGVVASISARLIIVFLGI